MLLLAAGIGAFAVGLLVIVSEAVSSPALYRRWKDRQLESRRVYTVTLVLISVGIVLTSPPVWQIFG